MNGSDCEHELACPKCGETALRWPGALYFACHACNYAWVPEQVKP